MEPLAESAGWMFGWLLRNSAHAAILALAVWLLEKTLLRKLSPRWRYGIWLVVFARLLVPIAPGSVMSLFNLVDFAPGAISGITLQVLGLPSPVVVPHTQGPHPFVDTPSWFLGAMALWLSGACVLAVLVYRDHQQLQIALARTQPITDSYILDLLRQSKAVMKVRRPIQLVEGDHVTSPAISGCRRTRLLVPSGLMERLTTDEIRFLFLHELAHVKRADLVLNWGLAAIQVLHWFNPAVWLAMRRLVSVREEVCDDFVLRSCFAGASREYGLTLLHLLEECAPRRLMPALAGILDDVRTLRQRIRCIRKFGEPESHPWIPAGVTLAVAVAGLTENRNHHALSVTASEVVIGEQKAAAYSHSSHRSKITTRRSSPSGRQSLSTLEASDDPGPTRRRPVSLFQSFSTAFRQALELPGNAAGDSSRDSSGSRSVSSDLSDPSARRHSQSPPGAVGAAGPWRHGSSVVAVPVSSQVASRPYPLPPVSQRGDIIRPLNASSATGRLPLTSQSRPLEVVPYLGRRPGSPSQSAPRDGG